MGRCGAFVVGILSTAQTPGPDISPIRGNLGQPFVRGTTPPSSPVVYSAAQDNANTLELYLADADDPGTAIKLNPVIAAPRLIDFFEMAPTPDRVIYIADHDTIGQYELYADSAVGRTD